MDTLSTTITVSMLNLVNWKIIISGAMVVRDLPLAGL